MWYFCLMHSLAEENYLKALFSLSSDNNGEVSVNDLSKHLCIKMPTVTSMMKKLAAKELVHYESYKPVRLTESGRKVAALVIRKHRLTEMFLVEKMGFKWDEVHDIAEQIEHIKAPSFFDSMEELMDYPQVDPHGSPIPDKDGNIKNYNYKKLSEFEEGCKVQVLGLNNSSKEFLEFLNSRCISLKTIMEIKSIEAFDSTMVVNYEGHNSESLSLKVCERLLVELI